MASVPDLRQLIADTPTEALPSLLGLLVEAEELARLRLRAAAAPTPPALQAEGNISVGEAARRLGVSPSYIYKNARSLPFVLRIGRRLVCSASRLERWNRARVGS